MWSVKRKRNRRVDNLLHKASVQALNIAVERKIDTIVLGKTAFWKQEIKIGKKNNQNFVQIPFSRFISMIKYKAERLGIQVLTTEESHTSKASFLSQDEIPVYSEENSGKHKFSGYRKTRSIYKDTFLDIEMHADINGSANIGRKMFPNMFDEIGLKSVLQTPIIVKLNQVRRRTCPTLIAG